MGDDLELAGIHRHYPCDVRRHRIVEQPRVARHLYHHLPEIRQRAAALVRRYSKVRLVAPPTLSGTPVLGSTLSVDPGSYEPSGGE